MILLIYKKDKEGTNCKNLIFYKIIFITMVHYLRT